MAEEELAREAAALRAAQRAIEPYVNEVAEYRRDTRTLKDGIADLRAIREELQKIQTTLRNSALDDERNAKYADDDRKRLAEAVKDEAGEHAAEIAKEVMAQAMKLLQINLDKAEEFTKDMQFLRELRETFGVMRRHAITVLIGIIMLGITTGVWQALKSGAKP